MTRRPSPLGGLTRREALGVLGAGAGLAFVPALEGSASVFAAAQRGVRGGSVTFPKGAIIRTLFKDMPPAQLAGTILFHEHLSIDLPQFNRPPNAPPAAPPPSSNINMIVDEVNAAKKDGVVCIVDGGHA